MQTCNYCIDDIIEAVVNSKSVAQVCRCLGLVSTRWKF